MSWLTFKIPLPSWVIICFFLLYLVFMGVIVYFVLKWWAEKSGDRIVIIDKNNRWNIMSFFLKGQKQFKYKDVSYNILDNVALLNKKGKVLLVYSEGKPTPLKIGYNENKWLDSESLKSILSNTIIQKILSPSNKTMDIIILMGALGGIIAGIASLLILLKTFGLLQ